MASMALPAHFLQCRSEFHFVPPQPLDVFADLPDDFQNEANYCCRRKLTNRKFFGGYCYQPYFCYFQMKWPNLFFGGFFYDCCYSMSCCQKWAVLLSMCYLSPLIIHARLKSMNLGPNLTLCDNDLNSGLLKILIIAHWGKNQLFIQELERI